MSTATLERPAARTFSGRIGRYENGHWSFEEVENLDLTGKGYVAVPDFDGDFRIIWDKRNPADVACARASFEQAQKEGMAIFKVEDDKGNKGEQVKKFDPEEERYIAVKPQKGG